MHENNKNSCLVLCNFVAFADVSFIQKNREKLIRELIVLVLDFDQEWNLYFNYYIPVFVFM